MRGPISRRATVGGPAPRVAPVGGYPVDSPTRVKSTPVSVPRTTRHHDVRVLTSIPAGKMTPVCVIPLLREDAIQNCTLRLSFEMMETAEILMNAVNVAVKAYLVPHLVYDRFGGSIDLLNKSYEGVAFGNDPVVPFFTMMGGMPDPKTNQVHVYLGKHVKANTPWSSIYLEAYNEIWNFRAKNRSPDLALRSIYNANLAPAFWQHQGFAHIVPDFDQAMIDGEVPLAIQGGSLPVRGLYTAATAGTNNAAGLVDSVGYQPVAGAFPATTAITAEKQAAAPYAPIIFAELAENGITVTLSNIELARKTQAFAQLRRQFSGHTDEYLIDLLMDGISIPEQMMAQPMLLAERNTIFGMSKRYASDAANLTESVVNGATFVDLNIRTPKIGVGGVVMVVVEITPEQLFERQADPYLFADNPQKLPQFLRDTLDPEKVSVVPNKYVDVNHATPDGVFGYAPLNHEWNHTAPCIGGRFSRPTVDGAFDEDRQRIWSVETANPTLSTDFYLCTNMHTKPFVVTNQDPFEVVIRGGATITGHTVFGQLLIEASDDYEQVFEEAPIERINKPVTTDAETDDQSDAAE